MSFDRPSASTLEKALSSAARQQFSDPDALVHYHELLLFLRAYPHNSRLVTLTEKELAFFSQRIQALAANEVDISSIETPEISGIAGTSVTDTFSYCIVRWLARLYPGEVSLYWEWFEDDYRLAETWPRFMPLLEEDAFVEANVPYRKWLRAAAGPSDKALIWLVNQFESLSKTDQKKAELFDSQKLYVQWSPPYRATRTGMRLPVSKVFYHREPLIQRRDVSLKGELDKPSPKLERVSTREGEAVLDMARAASTIRYRELYGFTHGDANRVFKTNLGRGVDVFVTGLPPNRRLPLRAYHAAMIFKNGVPVGYFEGLSLFERMEGGFNLYYGFRDGETAWLYARTLNIFRHLLGVTAFSLDPYQIGYENEEGIASGALWFYRKLGFRPTDPRIMKLLETEEKKIKARSTYRTSARTLRKLAVAPMIYEHDKSRPADWDEFQVRNIGLAVQRRMAAEFDGDAQRIRATSVKELIAWLGNEPSQWRETELPALNDFAVTLSLVKDLRRWSQSELDALATIIHAKAGADESTYLKLMQNHSRLRNALIRLGSE
ncbi:MAG: hypothetical protein ABR501_12145 [Pyrinomonadaceae bacterium]